LRGKEWHRFWFGHEQRIQKVGMEIDEKRNGQQRRRGTFQTKPTVMVRVFSLNISCQVTYE